MKDTGKTISGVKVYSDPEVPPDTLFFLNGNFKSVPPRRDGKIVNIGWHKPTVEDSLWYKIKYWFHNQFTDWPDDK